MSGSWFSSEMDLDQAMFIAEAEGETSLVDTNEANFNAAMIDIKEALSWSKGQDIDVTAAVDDILFSHGIDPSDLSRNEVARIQRFLE